MDDLDNPVDVLPEHSPDKQTGAAADADDEPSGKPAANAAGALPASSSAADASKASGDTAMPTPIAGKAMQQLVIVFLCAHSPRACSSAYRIRLQFCLHVASMGLNQKHGSQFHLPSASIGKEECVC